MTIASRSSGKLTVSGLITESGLRRDAGYEHAGLVEVFKARVKAQGSTPQAMQRSTPGVHMLEESASGQYRFHDLLRAYAAERALADETSADRHTAIVRLLTWYLHTADAARQQLVPAQRWIEVGPRPPGCEPGTFTGYQQALAWYDAEHANLIAAVRQAAGAARGDLTWKLAISMWSFFDLRKPWTDWRVCATLGLAAARGADDRQGEGAALHNLGVAYRMLCQPDEARECYQRALTVRRQAGDRKGEAETRRDLGDLLHDSGKSQAASQSWSQALAIFGDLGAPQAAELRDRLVRQHIGN